MLCGCKVVWALMKSGYVPVPLGSWYQALDCVLLGLVVLQGKVIFWEPSAPMCVVVVWPMS